MIATDVRKRNELKNSWKIQRRSFVKETSSENSWKIANIVHKRNESESSWKIQRRSFLKETSLKDSWKIAKIVRKIRKIKESENSWQITSARPIRYGLISSARAIFRSCKTICTCAGTRTCNRSCLRTRTGVTCARIYG